MKITYVSSAMEKNSFTRLFCDSGKVPGQQAQKFNRLMIEGLGENGIAVTALSGLPVTTDNCYRKVISGQKIHQKNVAWHYPVTLNIPGIKNLWQMTTVFVATLKKCLHKDSAVVCDVLNASVALGAVSAARMLRRPCVGVVTDLPHLMVTGTNTVHTKIVNKVLEKCTGYMFLTEAMNDVVNPKGKPYIIVEGVCDVNMESVTAEKKNDNKVCMYAGLLDARYGAKTMVDAFLLADVPDAQLHLYGNGPYVPELEKIAEKHANVIYHGTVMNDEIVAAELQATILINPRPTHETFTKYSFPSKNLEYMVSGTPVLTTKLPGMPAEYYPYVYLLEDETTQGMAETFKLLLNQPTEELAKKGYAAKRFVLERKSNVYQTKRLIELLQALGG